jgi:hypothetical protein
MEPQTIQLRIKACPYIRNVFIRALFEDFFLCSNWSSGVSLKKLLTKGGTSTTFGHNG